MSGKVRLVYILSASHSGSTLLDLLLNAHEAFTSVGELKNLQAKLQRHPDLKCTCGEPVLQGCSFWRGVSDQLKGAGLDLEAIGTDGRDQSFVASNVALLRAISRQSGDRVIVDSSKNMRRLHMLDRSSEIDILPVVLARDPRGQVLSTIRKDAGLLAAIRDYNRAYRTIHGALRTRPYVFVQYEELVYHSEEALEPILAFFGERFQPEQMNWAASEKHSVAGNRMRHRRDSSIRVDDAWRREMPALHRVVVQAGTWRTRRRLARLRTHAARHSHSSSSSS